MKPTGLATEPLHETALGALLWVQTYTEDTVFQPVPAEDRERLIRIEAGTGAVLELRKGQHGGKFFWARMREML